MFDPAFMEVLKQFGPFVALLVFFIWRDKQREERLGARLDAMQDRYAVTMETIVKDNTGAMESMAEAARGTSQALAANTTAITQLSALIQKKEAA